MDKETTPDVQYEKPVISDYGDLKDLTAGLSTGPATDKLFPAKTPFNQLTFS